jgi:putative phosphoesterase
MKLLVISDSHGNSSHAFKAHELAGPVDHIIHLGDGADDARLMEQVLEVPVHKVAGNCDYEPQLPRELTLEFGECRVLVTHGNRQSVKAGLGNLIGRGMEVGATVVLYGHTHLPAVDSAEGMLLVNPGPLKEGLTPSYAIVTVDGSEVHAELFGFTAPLKS